MAYAISYIDTDLIDEANEAPASRSKVLSAELLKRIYSIGTVAACLILSVAIIFLAKPASPDVLLFGESISTEARSVTEYIPRSITYSVEPHTITDISIPLELEFAKKTKLTSNEASMTVLSDNGENDFEATEYEADGKVSLCLVVPSGKSQVTIETNRNYNIVLTLDEESDDWYVHIDKNN